jgi:ATP-dependent DNA helicase DinG
MKRGVSVSGGKCSASCSHARRCRYFKYLRESSDPSLDFQITNHNYFLADILHRTDGRRPILPHYQMVIIDEAHKFLDAARSMYGMELTDAELHALATEIHAFTTDKSFGGVNVHRLAKKAGRAKREAVPQAECEYCRAGFGRRGGAVSRYL